MKLGRRCLSRTFALSLLQSGQAFFPPSPLLRSSACKITSMTLGSSLDEARVEESRALALPLSFVTSNPQKFLEFKMIVTAWSDVVPLQISRVDLELEELQDTHVEISKAKCRLAAERVNGPAVVEDTALCFNGLGGLPGPYVKFFEKAVGLEGMHRMLHAFDDKTAFAQCVVSFALGPGYEPRSFVGQAHGTIVAPSDGTDGFGWDKIMLPHGYNVTFAEMPREEKNKISHRAMAMAAFHDFLRENGEELLAELEQERGIR